MQGNPRSRYKRTQDNFKFHGKFNPGKAILMKFIYEDPRTQEHHRVWGVERPQHAQQCSSFSGGHEASNVSRRVSPVCKCCNKSRNLFRLCYHRSGLHLFRQNQHCENFRGKITGCIIDVINKLNCCLSSQYLDKFGS
jgi:hypothetical protein